MPNKLLNTYLSSKELKKLVIRRSEELEIPFRYICHEVGVRYHKFMAQYINGASGTLEISEEKFEGILALLGINMRFQFVVEKGFKALEVRERLKYKYDTYKEGKNDFRGEPAEEEAGNYPVFDSDN